MVQIPCKNCWTLSCMLPLWLSGCPGFQGTVQVLGLPSICYLYGCQVVLVSWEQSRFQDYHLYVTSMVVRLSWFPGNSPGTRSTIYILPLWLSGCPGFQGTVQVLGVLSICYLYGCQVVLVSREQSRYQEYYLYVTSMVVRLSWFPGNSPSTRTTIAPHKFAIISSKIHKSYFFSFMESTYRSNGRIVKQISIFHFFSQDDLNFLHMKSEKLISFLNCNILYTYYI